MNFVVDASVALAWCFGDEDSVVAEQALERLNTEEAIVPALWPLEVTNGLLTAERRGRLDRPDAARALVLVSSLPIAIDPLERRRTFESTCRLARAHGLTSYDAAYLDLAARLGVPLATLDTGLADAAAAEGVELMA